MFKQPSHFLLFTSMGLGNCKSVSGGPITHRGVACLGPTLILDFILQIEACCFWTRRGLFITTPQNCSSDHPRYDWTCSPGYRRGTYRMILTVILKDFRKRLRATRSRRSKNYRLECMLDTLFGLEVLSIPCGFRKRSCFLHPLSKTS